MQGSQLQCSLCSREFQSHELRRSLVSGGGGNDCLCQMCWQVLCTQPWPTGGGGEHGNGTTGHVLGNAVPSPFAAPTTQDPKQGSMPQRRSVSLANIQAAGRAAAVAVPSSSRPQQPWQPASMPEQHVILAGSAEDSRWNIVSAAVGGSAQTGAGYRRHPTRGGSAHGGTAFYQQQQPQQGQQPFQGGPPTFSPVELRNMMDEESLMLFESQSHLLDPEGRQAVQRQRQYLEWQNSLEEAGPMQSALERQESAGSGCNQANDDAGAFQAGSGGGGGVGSGREGGSVHGSGHGMARIVDELRRQLGQCTQERDALGARLQEAQAELEEHRQETLCKMCHSARRNCVILPCLHFMSCDDCFKRHCSASPTCPACNAGVTGFQTLLMLQ